MRVLLSLLAAAGLVVFDGSSLDAQPADAGSIVGAWSLNREASDQPRQGPGADGRGRDAGAGRGGGRRGGGPGGPGGGFGRGGGRGGFGGRGGGAASPEDLERRVEGMRAILQPADRLTITRTESMVIVTTGDGVTTRLAPDGSKVKDESTGIERRTRWEGTRLVTEISGAGSGRITESYAVDASTGRLIVTLQLPERRNAQADTPQTLRRVYDPQR
jgi:hypothetical protein